MVEIKATCDSCETVTDVYHLDWTHILCPSCGSEISNNLFEEYVDAQF